MLTPTKIPARAVREYYARMAALSKDKSYWLGDGARRLGKGLSSQVDADELYALCAIGPKAAAAIEAGQGESLKYVISGIETHQGALERPRVAGYDLTLGADKSASLTFLAHPDQAVRDAAGLAHRLAVHNVARFIQDKAGLSRITSGGVVSVVPGEMIFAAFTHFTNRNLEPHLHSHVLVPNVVRCEDGTWRSLRANELYDWYMVAGALYRASFREHMNRLTNAEWTISPNGWACEIAGLAAWKGPDGARLLPAFSTRHAECEDARRRLEDESPDGTISPKVSRSLAVRTRAAKDFGDGDARIGEISEGVRSKLADVWKLADEQWREILAAYGEPRPETRVAGLWLRMPDHLAPYGEIPIIQSQTELVDYMARVLFDEGGGRIKEGILSGRAYVAAQDVEAAAYNAFGGFLEREVLAGAIAALMRGEGTDRKLALAPLVPALFVKGKHVKPSRVPVRYYATGGVLNSEARVLELAAVPTTAGVLDAEVVDEYLARVAADAAAVGGHGLAPEQEKAMRHLFSAKTTAALLMGAQGSGKTTLFRHFAELAKESGTVVWGLAPQGTAVNKLGDTLRRIDPDARSMTIESFVGQVRWGSLALAPNTCLILDESSQVDTLELAEVLEIAEQAGAKLVLVGDDRQLGSVRYGGMFATLFAQLGGARLVTTRRAESKWDRTAQAYLRMGDLKGALRLYEQQGRISVADDGLALMESVGDWLRREFEAGSDSFVITNTKAEEMAANALAHEVWDGHRQAWMKGYFDSQVRHHRSSDKLRQERMQRFLEIDPSVTVVFGGSQLTLRMGDLVAIRQSVKIDAKTRLTNGQRGRVVDVTDKTVTLFIQEESSARHVTIARTMFETKRNLVSYGWASTVFRTQAMEFGGAGGEVPIADESAGFAPDTPVLIARSTHRSKTFAATVLEDEGDTVAVRLANGKIRHFARRRVSVSEETRARIDNLAVAAVDGNALVVGTEGMNLDALLVAASRARQRTDFLFRSALATENDLGGEKLAQASDADVVQSTMLLYLARQSRAEEPDSAYLRLAREREAISLAAEHPLDLLSALRSWLGDNLTSGTLQLAVDEQAPRAKRDQAEVRLAKLESQLAGTQDPQLQAHLAAEIDRCAAEIEYARGELARMKTFAAFLGHAHGALGGDSGTVVDERYIKDRIALVEDAMAMAENMAAWTEVPDGSAIAVPLPENTSREVVDVSSEREVDLDTKAKLFCSVSYRVASAWMRLAEGLYDRAMADGLSPAEVLARVDVSDDDHLRLREALAAVAIGRAHPTPVGHPVTLRTIASEDLAEGVDQELVALIGEMTESVSDRRERRAERDSRERSAARSEDEDGEDGEPPEEDDIDRDGGDFWVPGEGEAEPEPEYRCGDEFGGDAEPSSCDAPGQQDPAPNSPSGDLPSRAKPDSTGQAPEKKRRPDLIWGTWDSVPDADPAGLLDDTSSPVGNPETVPAPAAAIGGDSTSVTSPEESVQPPSATKSGATAAAGAREYVRGFYYKNAEGTWCVDQERRSELWRIGVRLQSTPARVSPERWRELFEITKPVEIAPNEWYIPTAELLAEVERERAEAERYAARNRGSYKPSGGAGSGEGSSRGHSGGYGYGRRS